MSWLSILIPVTVAAVVAASFHRSMRNRRGLELANGVLALAAAAAGAAAASHQMAAGLPVCLLAQVIAALVLAEAARREAGPATPPAPVRAASLDSGPLVSPLQWLLFALPLVMLGAAALYLDLNFDRIPDRFPVHWDLAGNANGWRTRTPGGVFGILGIGLSTLLLLYGSAAALAFGARRGAGRESAQFRLLGATMWMLAAAAVFASAVICWAALLPLRSDPQSSPSLAVFVPLLLLPLGAVIFWVRFSAAGSAAEQQDASARDESWTFGVIYYNPEDPAMMVPRRIGWGFTPNFGHPVMKIAGPILIAQVIGVVYLTAK